MEDIEVTVSIFKAGFVSAKITVLSKFSKKKKYIYIYESFHSCGIARLDLKMFKRRLR